MNRTAKFKKKIMGQKVVFIGAGNLATQLGKALYTAGNEIVQVFSRNIDHARQLARQLESSAIDDIRQIELSADCYIFALKDDVLPAIAAQMPTTDGVWIHTAGSLPVSVLSEYKEDVGVLYPLQTFSKSRNVSFSDIPIFIEANNSATQQLIESLARSISEEVHVLSGEKRKYLHLAAVFACNFTNHFYTLAEEILQKEHIPFDVLKPLIRETADKVMERSPREAQTGPAVRFDEKVMQRQVELLSNDTLRKLYWMVSNSIHDHSL